MTPQRRRQVKEICGAVLDHAPEKRDALLAQLCSDDAELKREVEGLIRQFLRPFQLCYLIFDG
jgi:hypothetical protein